MSTKFRRQLTLFVEATDAANIKQVRTQFNPVQRSLINCHVTLCREDELEDLQQIMSNINTLKTSDITIHFGRPIRFAEGKGVLLPGITDNKAFHSLRKLILQGVNDHPRKHEPHITLLHPRNSTCTDEVFSEIGELVFPSAITFKKISLIEQADLNSKWELVQEFSLQEKHSA
ncbi:MAG: 2'-5' RNA ligase family protein [Lacibacter sp.]